MELRLLMVMIIINYESHDDVPVVPHRPTTGVHSMAQSQVSALIVGADRLGNIPDLLRDHNIAIRHHISGRDPAHQKKAPALPSGTDLVILLTDFLGHNVMKTFRLAAQRAGIRVLACRRSVCSRRGTSAATVKEARGGKRTRPARERASRASGGAGTAGWLCRRRRAGPVWKAPARRRGFSFLDGAVSGKGPPQRLAATRLVL